MDIRSGRKRKYHHRLSADQWLGKDQNRLFRHEVFKTFKAYGQQNYDEKQVYRGFWRKFDQNQNFRRLQERT